MGSQWYATRVGIGDSAPATTVVNMLNCTLKTRKSYANGNGAVGSRSELSRRARISQKAVGGQLVCNPNIAELALFARKFLGGTPSGISYPLATTIPSFVACVDSVAQATNFTGCVVSRARLSGAPGQPFTLTMDVVGLDDAVTTFPSITFDNATGPLMFHDLSLSVDGTTVPCFSWAITVDNVVDAGRFMNSLTLTSADVQARIVTTEFQLAWDAVTVDMYDMAENGVPVIATITNTSQNTVSAIFNMPNVQVPGEMPDIQQLQELQLPIVGQARRPDSSTAELATTIDATV